MNCTLHKNQNASHTCSVCGAPICEDCYDLHMASMCPFCFNYALEREKNETFNLYDTTRTNLISMYIGLIVGLILAISLTIFLSISDGTEGLIKGLICFVFIVSICGNFRFILYSFYAPGLLNKILSIAFAIVCSPICAIIRFVKDKKSLRSLQDIYYIDCELLEKLAEYIKQGNEEG